MIRHQTLREQVAQQLGWYKHGRKNIRWCRQADADEFGPFDVTELLNGLCALIATELKESGPDDVEVEAPGYEPPTEPLVAADHAFNQANKMWRTHIDKTLGGAKS